MIFFRYFPALLLVFFCLTETLPCAVVPIGYNALMSLESPSSSRDFWVEDFNHQELSAHFALARVDNSIEGFAHIKAQGHQRPLYGCVLDLCQEAMQRRKRYGPCVREEFWPLLLVVKDFFSALKCSAVPHEPFLVDYLDFYEVFVQACGAKDTKTHAEVFFTANNLVFPPALRRLFYKCVAEHVSKEAAVLWPSINALWQSFSWH